MKRRSVNPGKTSGNMQNRYIVSVLLIVTLLLSILVPVLTIQNNIDRAYAAPVGNHAHNADCYAVPAGHVCSTTTRCTPVYPKKTILVSPGYSHSASCYVWDEGHQHHYPEGEGDYEPMAEGKPCYDWDEGHWHDDETCYFYFPEEEDPVLICYEIERPSEYFLVCDREEVLPGDVLKCANTIRPPTYGEVDDTNAQPISWVCRAAKVLVCNIVNTSPTPSPTLSPAPSPTLSPTPSPTLSPTPSPEPSYTPSPAPSYTPSPAPRHRPTVPPTSDPSPSPSPSPSPDPRNTEPENITVEDDPVPLAGDVIYDYFVPPIGFTEMPHTINSINDEESAKEAIKSIIMSITDEERQSRDTLDIIALIIENAVRRGANQTMSGDLVLSSELIAELAASAGSIMENSGLLLGEEDINLLRHLRTNITILSEESDSLHITFPDGVSDIDFDNITIEAPFAAVTISKDNILMGGEIDLKNLSTDTEQERSLSILDFWSLFTVALFIGAQIMLNFIGHKLRTWVLPTFCAIAVGINVATFFADSGNMKPLQHERITDKVELIMTEGMSVILSLPATEEEKDTLLLLNEDSIPQHSKYNPVSGMIDSRVHESGIYTLREYTVSFADIEHKNAIMIEAITQLASRHIITGVEDGFFHPDDLITRAEFISAVIRVFDINDFDAVSGFSDVSISDWYYSAVATAAEKRVITGFSDNTFRGELHILKDALVVVAANLMIEEMNYIVPEDTEAELMIYSDRDEIEEWAVEGVALATKSNILIHRIDGLFAPDSTKTRGDAAIVLYRLFQKVW